MRCSTLCLGEGRDKDKKSFFHLEEILTALLYMLISFSFFIPVAGAHPGLDASDSAILAQELEPYLR